MTRARSDLELKPEELWLASVGAPAGLRGLPWSMDPKVVSSIQVFTYRSARAEGYGIRLVRAL